MPIYPYAIETKYDMAAVIEVINGNPNGSKDAGNAPLQDTETGHGLITPVCIKRKIRDAVALRHAGFAGYDIYITRGTTLRTNDAKGFMDVTGQSYDPENKSEAAKAFEAAKASLPDLDIALRDAMCRRFYDVRTFGGVMTTFTENGLNCGQVKGPVQVEMGRTVDPVSPQYMTIGRVAVTSGKEDNTTFGQTTIVPYGLYVVWAHVSASEAQRVTGFSPADMDVLKDAILHMFDNDHAAWRAGCSVRDLFVFQHDSKLGSVAEWKLREALKIKRKPGVAVARSYHDYDVDLDMSMIPKTVTVERF